MTSYAKYADQVSSIREHCNAGSNRDPGTAPAYVIWTERQPGGFAAAGNGPCCGEPTHNVNQGAAGAVGENQMPRVDGRGSKQMRISKLTRGFMPFAEGSCLVEMGNTRVICTASVEDKVP